jgi:hypothetical protein
MRGRDGVWVLSAIVAVLGLGVVATAGAPGTAGPAEPPAKASSNAPVSINPLTPTDPNRLPPAEAAALRALASKVGDPPPATHTGHDHNGPAAEVPLAAADQATFDQQWAAARAAAVQLATPEDAVRAGYRPAAVWGGGIGTHYVKWSLIAKPFDPARPSMVLYDDRPGRPARLAGFSYWVKSPTQPDGFAGPNDQWHQHAGECIVNGWVDREDLPGPAQCAGVWMAGGDLWMLHAWVAPGFENRWGNFAVRNPLLCPSRLDVPEYLQCTDATQ